MRVSGAAVCLAGAVAGVDNSAAAVWIGAAVAGVLICGEAGTTAAGRLEVWKYASRRGSLLFVATAGSVTGEVVAGMTAAAV